MDVDTNIAVALEDMRDEPREISKSTRQVITEIKELNKNLAAIYATLKTAFRR